MSEYINADGLVMNNKEKTDGNDAPHKTGFYYGGLALKGWLTEADVFSFIKAIESILTRGGKLLRHKNTRLPTEARTSWQPSSRDQYQAIFYGLGLCRKHAPTDAARLACEQLLNQLYNEMRWSRVARIIPMASRDILSPQHWYAIGVATSVKQAPWFKFIAGVSEVINNTLLLLKHSQSANILSYFRNMLVHDLDRETWLHGVADSMMDLRFDFGKEMRTYWTRYGGPPIHKVFLGEED